MCGGSGTHLYFIPGQFIRDPEIEAAPTRRIKAGATHARKGGRVRRDAEFKVTVTAARGMGGRPGAELGVLEDTWLQPQERGASRVGSQGIATINGIYGVVEA